ncbi:hypothetical protein [Marinicellulosiphila megalodicopiae]|uniref:hypothetical protein n=1 Tax=Marinicellulosiphila megalodicopiae TaxID=2724896 RepID=UPI003BAE3E8A
MAHLISKTLPFFVLGAFSSSHVFAESVTRSIHFDAYQAYLGNVAMEINFPISDNILFGGQVNSGNHYFDNEPNHIIKQRQSTNGFRLEYNFSGIGQSGIIADSTFGKGLLVDQFSKDGNKCEQIQDYFYSSFGVGYKAMITKQIVIRASLKYQSTIEPKINTVCQSTSYNEVISQPVAEVIPEITIGMQL